MHQHFDFSVERYNILKQQGFYPKTAIDIGANLGQWYTMFNSIFPDTEVFSIEGNEACAPELGKVNPNYKIAMLGKEEGTQTFYLNENYDKCSGGSLYKETSWAYTNCNELTKEVKTLDSLNLDFDLIKMDVQGGELDIIKGGLKTVLNSSFLQLELAVLEFNSGAPSIGEVISYLHHLDFSVYDIASHFYWNHRLNQVDVMFVNNKKLGHLLKL